MRHKDLIGTDTNLLSDLACFIAGQPPSCTGIIYCHTKAACDELSSSLAALGLRARSYHAGLTPKTRIQVQTEWMSGAITVVCATVAFGMGIDKGNVRFVVHHSVPKSLEAYYQETGRAGRDGADSEVLRAQFTCFSSTKVQTLTSKWRRREALLYYHEQDISMHRFMIQKGCDEGFISQDRMQVMLSTPSIRPQATTLSGLQLLLYEALNDGFISQECMQVMLSTPSSLCV